MADPIEVLTAKVDALAEGMAEGFARVERRLDAHDSRFDGIDGRVERKLDQLIDSELRR